MGILNMILSRTKVLETGLLLFAILTGIASAQLNDRGYLEHGLFIKTYGSRIGPTDPIMKQIVEGKAIHATAGEAITLKDGKVSDWQYASADSSDWFKGKYLEGDVYSLFNIRSDERKVVLLETMGDELVYVNGVPHEGNKYGYKDDWEQWEPAFNFSEIPVRLEKGDNQFLFLCHRGVLKVRLVAIKPGVLFNAKHPTLPDFISGSTVDDYAAVDVINATDSPLDDAVIKAFSDSGISASTGVPLVQPMSVRKVGFKLSGVVPSRTGLMKVQIDLVKKDQAIALDSTDVHVRIVEPSATHNVTYLSNIDSSVQYYSVVPPKGPDDGRKKALFLSLHGADVVTTNMANSYYAKNWGYIVCPTNGGPYGYDWEEWGRLDALQVLGIARTTLNIDPSRVYLTGHSMGGHGTWIIGAQYPDLFGALGPSAGWISWWTYVIHDDTSSSPMADMLRRAMAPENTFGLAQNYKQLGVYVLQGSKDDNVPVTESISMSDTLSKFDKDFIFHEQPGAGHWWGLQDEAGADCVDWPPMFDYFARHARAGEKRTENIDFTTMSPGVSAKDYWLTIYSQQRQLERSRAIVRFIPSRNRFTGTTENVNVISFDLTVADRNIPLNVDLDSTNLDSIKLTAGTDRIWLENGPSGWKVSSEPPAGDKNPVRYGTFKDAFRHDVEFIYGTHGNNEENRWAFDKARADAEYFWYQGGGSIDVISDRDFNPAASPDRNIILYGNESTNSAWNEVLEKCPVSVTNGRLNFGEKTMKGDDYACFMVQPRKGSETASVGVVSGSGTIGMKLSYIVPYLQPGFALPDLTILNEDVFDDGLNGVKVAGFFGLDWSIQNGEFVIGK